MSRDVQRLSPDSENWVRTCIRAAVMRTQFTSFAKIAAQLDLASPSAAQKAVQQGLAFLPSENVPEARRLEAERQARIGRELWAVVENPGPLVSQGKVIMRDDPDAPPEAYPDQMVRVRALEALVKLGVEIRRMGGLDAPKRTMTITPEMVTERIIELKRELGLGDEGPIPGLVLPEGERGNEIQEDKGADDD